MSGCALPRYWGLMAADLYPLLIPLIGHFMGLVCSPPLLFSSFAVVWICSPSLPVPTSLNWSFKTMNVLLQYTN